MKTLITGGAGSGKTTIIAALKKRGCVAIDLDVHGVCRWVNRKTGEEAEYRERAGREWIEAHRYEVEIPKLRALLESFDAASHIFVGVKPTSTQMGDIAEIFDAMYLLIPSDDVLRERLATRTNNNFAKTPEEREAIVAGIKIFNETCLNLGATLLNADEPVDTLIQRILAG